MVVIVGEAVLLLSIGGVPEQNTGEGSEVVGVVDVHMHGHCRRTIRV